MRKPKPAGAKRARKSGSRGELKKQQTKFGVTLAVADMARMEKAAEASFMEPGAIVQLAAESGLKQLERIEYNIPRGRASAPLVTRIRLHYDQTSEIGISARDFENTERLFGALRHSMRALHKAPGFRGIFPNGSKATHPGELLAENWLFAAQEYCEARNTPEKLNRKMREEGC